MTLSTDRAMQNLRSAVKRGLDSWKDAGRIGDPVPVIADEVARQELLITGGMVRHVQEVDFKDETDESRSYEVYTEPDR